MVWWLLPAILIGFIGIATIALLTWDTIMDYISSVKYQVPNAKVAEIVKERIASGRVRIYVGVFAPKFLGLGEKPVAHKVYDEVEELDHTAMQNTTFGQPMRIKL
jgi:hypothetical protein